MIKRLLLSIFLLALLCQNSSAQEPHFQRGHTHDILKVKFSPADRHLISYSAGDGRLCLWDIESGRLLWMTRTEFIQKTTEPYNLREFHWSTDGQFIVTRSDNGSYQRWDARTGRILTTSDQAPAITLAVDKAKKISITRGDGGFLLSNSEAKEVFTIKSFSRTATAYDVSHDGSLFAEGGSWGDAAIKLTEVNTGESRFLEGHPGIVKAIAYTADGAYLAVAGGDRNVYLFDAARRVLVRTLVGHAGPINSIAFNRDGHPAIGIVSPSIRQILVRRPNAKGMLDDRLSF